jgi:predicted TIM-barrel fold metal-dependent hydrolase
MRKPPDDHATVPFPIAPVSNMEWCPDGFSAKQQQMAKLIAEETETRARRLGLTRAQFLRTAAATTTAFMVMNKVYGLDQSGDAAAMPVKKVHCDDPDAARELLDRKTFVMDVQQHHVDLNLYGAGSSAFCFLDFTRSLPFLPHDLPCPENIGQLSFVKEVFVDSETDVGVISGLPGGTPLGPAAMADTRDLVNELAGSERCLAQAVCDPTNGPGTPTSVDSLEHQVRDRKARALKSYTYNGFWRLDDEQIAYPMLAEASRLGLRLVNVHKGLPLIFDRNNLDAARMAVESVRTLDFPKVVQDWPHLKFCAYHSAYFQPQGVGAHPLGKSGVTEWLEVVQSIPKKLRRNVYTEIGTTFAFTFLQGPDQAAHLLGKLLKVFGSKNILWGTDSVWWGSPQWQIDAFKTLEIPAALQEQFGYPPLTPKAKRRILGENAANLYGVKTREKRCTVPADRLAQMQVAQGGARAGRTLRWYGAQTRREFLTLLRREAALRG